MPKIERSSSLVSTPKIQSVSRPSAPDVTVPKGPVTEYAGQAAPQKDLLPKQQNVSRSASPSALWGDAPRQVELDPVAFEKLAPAEQQKVVEAARVERKELAGEIVDRVEVLDKKWGHSRLSTRTEALREYHERRGGRMDGGSRRKLDGLVKRSEESQRKINELRAKVDALPKTPESKKAMAELRNELAKELRRARDEQSKVVKEATAVVDAVGLKVDRLATTEQIIDPTAPAEGSGGSLLDKIGRFFKLDWFFNAIGETFDKMQSSFAQSVERRGERLQEEAKANLDFKRARNNVKQDRVAASNVEADDNAEAEMLNRARAAIAPLAPAPAAAKTA
ncbi:MAG: hypothetical protein Q8L48_22165 [Archangium sp.]|nr:hypothetical protein [Archangium sp.]